MGSAGELEYHILLARDLKLIQPKDYDALHQPTTVKRMLMALMHKLNADR
jgi:four helix bundle protein